MIIGFVAESVNTAASIIVREMLEMMDHQSTVFDESAPQSNVYFNEDIFLYEIGFFTVGQLSGRLKSFHNVLSDGLSFPEDEEEEEEEEEGMEDKPTRYNYRGNTKGSFSRRRRPLDELVAEYLDVMSQPKSPTGNEHCILYRSDKKQGAIQYRLNREYILNELRQNLIDFTMVAQFDNSILARRIVRILRKHQRLEEKQIAKMSMMQVNDVRRVLQAMLVYGVVGLQEVPRTTDRAPSRTFYLWFLKDGFANDNMSKTLLDIVSKLFKRIEYHQDSMAVLLEKTNRADVKLDPGLLTGPEQHKLNELRDKERKILTAQSRLWICYWLFQNR